MPSLFQASLQAFDAVGRHGSVLKPFEYSIDHPPPDHDLASHDRGPKALRPSAPGEPTGDHAAEGGRHGDQPSHRAAGWQQAQEKDAQCQVDERQGRKDESVEEISPAGLCQTDASVKRATGVAALRCANCAPYPVAFHMGQMSRVVGQLPMPTLRILYFSLTNRSGRKGSIAPPSKS